MILPEKILKNIGQGENSDLSFLVSEFDKELDAHFGIEYYDGEVKITSDDEPIYKGLLQEALMTSYLDYHQIFKDMQPGQIFVDLGAGYCRGSLLATDKSYEIDCISIEVEPSRVQYAKKYLGDNSQNIVLADLGDPSFELPTCQAMLLYIPTGELLNKIIKKLIMTGTEGSILYVIESHGDFIENLRFYQDMFVEVPSQLKTSIQRHDFKIYKFRLTNLKRVKEKLLHIKIEDFSEKILLPYWLLKFSTIDKEVLVRSKISGGKKFRTWSANLKGSQLLNYNGEFGLQLQSPSRILQLDTQDKIIS